MVVTQIQGEKSTNNSELQFRVLHEVNEEEAEHALSLNSYHQDGNGNAPFHQWVFLEEVKECSDTSRGFGMWIVMLSNAHFVHVCSSLFNQLTCVCMYTQVQPVYTCIYTQ